MAGRQSGRLWLCALLVVWASAAGAVSDAAAYSGSSTAPQISGAAAPPGPGEGGAAGRSIVVLSDNVSITLARGTFEGALEPFGPGEACFRVDRPLDLVGQLVDGNYTLLSHGGGREAARRNRGVAGHGETVRWWFNGAEQPPLPVAWRSPDVADDSVINGTFFVRDWVPAPELTQSAGVYKMRFSFAGTRLSFPGLGEFLVYPPCEMPPLEVTALFQTRTEPRPFDGPVDAGRTVALEGAVSSPDGSRPSGGLVVSLGGCTLGPPLPGGLFIDELEVSVPGIPTVVYREGFEGGGAGWASGGEGGDWEAGVPLTGPSGFRGRACLGTGLHGPYSHLADEWVDSPSIDLSAFPSEARLSFALWSDLHAGDGGSFRAWNGRDWSDPVDLPGSSGAVWRTITVGLGTLTCGGKPFPVAGTPDLRLRFWLESTTPSARVSDGAFSMDWTVPADALAGPLFLSFRYEPGGPWAVSQASLKVDVRARTRFELASGGALRAGPGGWAEVRGRLLDAAARPLELPLGRDGDGRLRAFWDDGRGNVTEAGSVSGPNGTGWFSCAHRVSAGGTGNASFILRFSGSVAYQGAEAVVPCDVRGRPRFELDPADGAPRGGRTVITGRLLLGESPVSGVPVSVDGPAGRMDLVTGIEGAFSAAVQVPARLAGPVLCVTVRYAGGEPSGMWPLEPAEASIRVPVPVRLSVTFEGRTLEKGRKVETVLDGQRFSGLAGKVEDDTGAGAPGVEVVVSALRAGGVEILGKVRTGAGGYFSLGWSPGWSEPAGELRLEAVAFLPSSAPAVRPALFRVTARTLLWLDELPPLVPGGWADVAGTLAEDCDGSPGDPVRDAIVTISFCERSYTAVTDPAGRFRARCAVDRSSGNLTVGAAFSGAGTMGDSEARSTVSLRTVEAGEGPLRPSTGVPAALGRALAAGSFFAVVAAAALIAGTEAGRFKVILALVPLYSKIRKEEVLDQFVRGQVFGYIQANPGDHYSSIRQTLKLKNGTLAYHLRTLERESFVFSRMDGIFRRFYPGGLDPARVKLRDSVRETHRRILELIEAAPGITPKELAHRLGASHQVASYHVRVLSRNGRITLEQRGRNTLCYPAGGRAGGAGN